MLITVITIVKNRAKTISGTLDSLAKQSYQDFEFIVVDGGSTDGTLEIIRTHRIKIDKLISEPDNGLYDALNKGVRQASGDYLFFLHSDDELFDDFSLQKSVSTISSESNPDIFYAGVVFTNKHGAVYREWIPSKFTGRGCLSRGWLTPHTGTFVKRELFFQVGFFKQDFGSCGDYKFLLDLFSLDGVSTLRGDFCVTKMSYGGVSTKLSFGLIKAFMNDAKACRDISSWPHFTAVLKRFRRLRTLWLI